MRSSSERGQRAIDLGQILDQSLESLAQVGLRDQLDGEPRVELRVREHGAKIGGAPPP